MHLVSRDIWRRNSVFFYVYVIFFATLNILPQFFFLHYYPQQKTGYLMFALVIASVLSIAGIELAERIKSSKFNLKILTLLSLGGTGISSIFLFISSHWIIYLIFFLLIKFAINFIMHTLDVNFIRATPALLVSVHANSNAFFQLTAIIFASVYLGYLYDQTTLNVIFFVLLPFICLFIAWPEFDRCLQNTSNELTSKEVTTGKRRPLTTYQTAYLIYSSLVIGAYGIFSSILIYLLSDYFLLPDPKTQGGVILALTCSAGAFAIFFLAPKLISKHQPGYAPTTVYLMTALNILSLLLFIAKPMTSFGFVAILSIITGFNYGLFMSLSRAVISRFAKEIPDSNILSIYNNLPNYTFLVGFTLTFILHFITGYFEVSFYVFTLTLVLGLLPVSLYFFRKSLKQYLREHKT